MDTPFCQLKMLCSWYAPVTPTLRWRARTPQVYFSTVVWYSSTTTTDEENGMGIPEAIRFAAQNDRYCASLTDEDCAVIARYATHHCGGLMVLFRYAPDGRCIKSHESWGDEPAGHNCIVHNYDPETPSDPAEHIMFYANGHYAIRAFMSDHPEDEDNL